MTLHRPSRPPRPRPARMLLLCGTMLFACLSAHAQGRGPGGGPGGPGGGGPGGGMGGGGRMSFAGDRGPSPEFNRQTARTGPQLGLPGRWWDDGKTAKKVGLRYDQQRRMDEIFEANKGSLLTLLGNLQREEDRLVSLTPKELQDETKVFAAIDRVAQARADLEKANAHTLLLIRQQMDTSQLAALDHQIAGH